MANTLLQKRTATSGKVPAVGDLVLGQLGVNTYDGKLYLKKDNGSTSIVEIGKITLTGDATATGSGSIAVTLANTGVTAATYRSVTVDAKGRVTDGSNPTTLVGYGITDAVSSSLLGVSNGVATLDSSGKLATSQIPASLLGAVVYQGVWNAATNSPTLTSSTGTKGNYYKVQTAGSTTLDGSTNWGVGDIVIFNGATWDKIDGGDNEVLSVFGRTGAITLLSSDIVTALGFTPISGNQTITISGDATGSGTTAIALTLSNTGVSAGTYSSVTVDVKGRVTSAGQVSSSTIISALGYTPVNPASPSVTGTLTVTNSSNTTTLALSGTTGANGASILLTGNGATTPKKTISVSSGTLKILNDASSAITTIDDSGNATFTGNVSGKYFNRSVGYGLAAAGTTQGTATAIAAAVNVFSSGTGGALLPAASSAGISVVIMNYTGSPINIYPPTGCTVDSLATNAAFSLGANAKLEFIYVGGTQWFTMTAVYA